MAAEPHLHAKLAKKKSNAAPGFWSTVVKNSHICIQTVKCNKTSFALQDKEFHARQNAYCRIIRTPMKHTWYHMTIFGLVYVWTLQISSQRRKWRDVITQNWDTVCKNWFNEQLTKHSLRYSNECDKCRMVWLTKGVIRSHDNTIMFTCTIKTAKWPVCPIDMTYYKKILLECRRVQ